MDMTNNTLTEMGLLSQMVYKELGVNPLKDKGSGDIYNLRIFYI